MRAQKGRKKADATAQVVAPQARPKLKERIAEAEAQPASGGGDTGEDQDNGGDTSAPGSGGEADT
ncbi:MAG: hypothetical protein ABF271_00530, partial [Abyssibacter sp.]|uniref:hypothetical protein n=1 Tax=Abyssibacter sp. TaxID=2320200 RepID=UPI00321A47F8